MNDLNLQRVLSGYLEPGETSAIALGIENPESILILDDLNGIKEAQKLKLLFTATLGILIKAKKENHIAGVNSYFNAPKESGFRITDKIIELAIKESSQ